MYCCGSNTGTNQISDQVRAMAFEVLHLSLGLVPDSAAALISQVIVAYVCVTSEQIGIKLDRKLTGMHYAPITGDQICAELAHPE